MKILIIHNYYLERGGEDEVVDSEVKMLQKFGHKVFFYARSNKELARFPLFKKMHFLAKEVTWSSSTYKEIKALISKERPDIAHLHNILFMVSPSVYYALKEENVPVVQSLHNYRLLCPKGNFYKNGNICRECRNGNFKPSIINKCWRNSFLSTLLLTRILNKHLQKNIFQTKIDTYIASSEFSKNKFIEAGWSNDKIFVKPNFVDLEINPKSDFDNYAVFLGRLNDYKGIHTLLSAYRRLDNYNLKIIGQGPLFEELKEKLKTTSNIELLGRLPYPETIEYITKSSFLIFPSQSYESMPRVIIESFTCGVPIIASNLGVIKELVKDRITGLLFNPNDSDDLVEKIKYLIKNKELLLQMRKNARKEFEEKYTAENNYRILMHIYEGTIKNYKL